MHGGEPRSPAPGVGGEPVAKSVLVLHFGEDQIRGSEVCILQSVTALLDAGHRVVVARSHPVLDAELDPRVHAVLDEPFPEIMIDGADRSLPLVRYMGAVRRMSRRIREYGIDVVYCNSGRPCQSAVPAGWFRRVPVLCHFHHPVPRRYLYLWLVRFATALIYPSEYTRSVVRQKCGRDGRVVYNAVAPVPESVPDTDGPALRALHGIPADAVVIGQIGFLGPHKRPDLVVRSFVAAAERMPGLHLVLIGSGPMRDHLTALVRELDVSEQVTLTGRVESVHPWLASVIDVHVLASVEEGLGISVIEAAMHGVPSIVSDCTGLREVVEHEETGLRVTPDDPSTLTDAMLRLARDPEARRRLGEAAGRDVHQRFSLAGYRSAVVEAVESLV